MKKILFLSSLSFVAVPLANFTQACTLSKLNKALDDFDKLYKESMYFDKSLSLNPFVENYVKFIILSDDKLPKSNFEVNAVNLKQIAEDIKTFINNAPDAWNHFIDLDSITCSLSYNLTLEDYFALKNNKTMTLTNSNIIPHGAILNLATDNFVINVSYQKEGLQFTEAIAIYNAKIDLHQATSAITDFNLGSFALPTNFLTLSEELSSALYTKIYANKNVINSALNPIGILRNFITQPYSASFEADENPDTAWSYDYNFDFAKIKITENQPESEPLEIIDITTFQPDQIFNVEFIGNQKMFSGTTKLLPFTFSIKGSDN